MGLHLVYIRTLGLLTNLKFIRTRYLGIFLLYARLQPTIKNEYLVYSPLEFCLDEYGVLL